MGYLMPKFDSFLKVWLLFIFGYIFYSFNEHIKFLWELNAEITLICKCLIAIMIWFEIWNI